MAEVRLVDIKKIYPNQGGTKKKKGDVPEKKHNLQITEEGVVAVQQFSLDIADREFIVLVGPSGCGKSTTLRMIAGLEEISGGELTIDGKVLRMTIDQTITGFDAAPVIINSRTYVPIRYVAEALGAEVEWIADTQQIIIEK